MKINYSLLGIKIQGSPNKSRQPSYFDADVSQYLLINKTSNPQNLAEYKSNASASLITNITKNDNFISTLAYSQRYHNETSGEKAGPQLISLFKTGHYLDLA